MHDTILGYLAGHTMNSRKDIMHWSGKIGAYNICRRMTEEHARNKPLIPLTFHVQFLQKWITFIGADVLPDH